MNELLKFYKFGFLQCMDHVCYDIREGDINRNEAIDLVLQYDGKCSDEYVLNFCNYIDISIDEFWETAEKFRGNMWTKDSEGNYKNEVWEEIKKEQ